MARIKRHLICFFFFSKYRVYDTINAVIKMLIIKDLSVKVNDKKILDNFNLTVNDGEIHVIMGVNGAGKSTILKTIMHDSNYEVTNGSIIYNNNSLNDLSTTDIARLGIFLLNQNPLAIEGVTNYELMRASLTNRSDLNFNIFDLKKELEKACETIKLPVSFINREVNCGMSGGEKKKNELLHMFLLKPSLILLDELDSGLDIDALSDVCKAIKKYDEAYNPSIIIITHHNNILNYLVPDYVHVLSKGKIIKSGSKDLALLIEKEGFNGENLMTGRK